MTPYETLDVPVDATPAAIKAAFRRLAMKHHPDRGGDPAEMQIIQAAHDLLMDVGRRKLYDETGETGRAPENPRRQRALQMLGSMLDQVMEDLDKGDGDDLDYNNPISEVRKRVNALREVGVKHQTKITRRITQRQKALARLQRRGNDPILESMFQGMSVRDHEMLQKNEEQLNALHDVLDMLAEYSYDTLAKAPLETAAGLMGRTSWLRTGFPP